jgi:hypothetical protein
MHNRVAIRPNMAQQVFVGALLMTDIGRDKKSGKGYKD